MEDSRHYPDETVLDNNYPVHAGYCYVVDGRVERSMISGTVDRMRRDITAQGRTAAIIRSCDMQARGMFDRVPESPPTRAVPPKTRPHNRGGWRKKRR